MTVRMPTLPEFKKFARDVAPAAQAVLMARANAQLTREHVDAYIAPIFACYTFHAEPDFGDVRPITSPDDLYLCDLNSPEVADFYAQCDAAHRAHGFTGPQGHCPALEAENLVIKAENALIALAEPLFGIQGYMLGGERNRYLELLIGGALKAAPTTGRAMMRASKR